MYRELSSKKKGVICFGEIEYEVEIPVDGEIIFESNNLGKNTLMRGQDVRDEEEVEPEEFRSLWKITLKNLFNDNLSSKIRVSDIENDIINTLDFEWEVGKHIITIKLNPKDQNCCEIYTQVNLPSKKTYMRKYTTGNIVQFDTIRFILPEAKKESISDEVILENITINKENTCENIVSKVGENMIDISCSDTNYFYIDLTDELILKFEVIIPKSKIDIGLSENIEILFGNLN